MTSDSPAPRFYPGDGSAAALPLARYLPPLPPGMAAGWLAENVPPGSWVLDPLGASPLLALETARAGYRVLVASNNPVTSFMIETLAQAPKAAAFQAALAELATAKRGEERLERHLQGLYMTECDTCGEHVSAQAFLWRKGEAQPFGRLYHCPRCGESGERPVTKGDLDRLAAMGGDRLQRARALQRVILNEDEHRADVEEALENYLPRPLYVLFTLINRIEGLGLPPERLRLLQALMISIFDAGSTLWPWPGGKTSGRPRPKQLTVPPQFRENNLWLALEAAVEDWTQPSTPLPVTRWPELPPAEGGICLFRGRIKTLMPLPEDVTPGAILTVFPRPNQAFWTLSVLWSGWLWGPEAALPLRNVLDRRRYDWNWHTSAIHSALAAVGWNTPPQTPFFGILPELAPGFLSAVVVAAEAGGFRLEGLAERLDSLGRAEQGIAQGLWRPASGAREDAGGETSAGSAAGTMETAARAAIRADLAERAEPAPYLIEYAAGLQALAQSGAIPRTRQRALEGGIPGDLLTSVQAVLARTFADRSLLRLYSTRGDKTAGGEKTSGGEKSAERQAGEKTLAEEERGAWWLASPGKPAPDAELPLADRVEMEVVRFMQKRLSSGPADFSFDQLDAALCAQFRGLLTPPLELVRACLESYGETLPSDPERWRLRGSDSAAARKADLQEMRAAIESVGRRLGYQTAEQGSALAWLTGGRGEWWFYRMASSILSRYVLAPADPPRPLERCVLVLPGSRARLLGFKLRRDPRLAEAVRGWRFLKFRHLREIAGEEGLRSEGWSLLLDEDPLTDEATQMALFGD